VPDQRKPLFIVHDTSDGFIYSCAERRGRKWFARHWGEELDGGWECATMREASEFPLAHASFLSPFQPIQAIPFLLAHRDSFHSSALRLSRGTFYLAGRGTFHLAATRNSIEKQYR
jgi:hypothetical protein